MAYSNTYTRPGIYYETIPFGVNQVTLRCWGGGGAGASVTSGNYGAGGGGGAYSDELVAVGPGDILEIFVGAGGAPGDVDGGSSHVEKTHGIIFNQVVQVVCSAAGGTGVATNGQTGGNGGQSATGVGETKNSGGKGADTGGSLSGGGGGGAGDSGDGDPAIGSSGGSGAATGGGNGGNGRTFPQGPGGNGNAYGGGGGGAYRTSISQDGGSGGDGAVWISYEQANNILLCNVTSSF